MKFRYQQRTLSALFVNCVNVLSVLLAFRREVGYSMLVCCVGTEKEGLLTGKHGGRNYSSASQVTLPPSHASKCLLFTNA